MAEVGERPLRKRQAQDFWHHPENPAKGGICSKAAPRTRRACTQSQTTTWIWERGRSSGSAHGRGTLLLQGKTSGGPEGGKAGKCPGCWAAGGRVVAPPAPSPVLDPTPEVGVSSGSGFRRGSDRAHSGGSGRPCVPPGAALRGLGATPQGRCKRPVCPSRTGKRCFAATSGRSEKWPGTAVPAGGCTPRSVPPGAKPTPLPDRSCEKPKPGTQPVLWQKPRGVSGLDRGQQWGRARNGAAGRDSARGREGTVPPQRVAVCGEGSDMGGSPEASCKRPSVLPPVALGWREQRRPRGRWGERRRPRTAPVMAGKKLPAGGDSFRPSNGRVGGPPGRCRGAGSCPPDVLR